MVGELAGIESLGQVSNTLLYAYAPLGYFAVRELLYRDFKYHWLHVLHFIPFAVAFSVTAILHIKVLPWLVVLVFMGYALASFRLLVQYDAIVVNTRSSDTPSGVSWLWRAMYVYSGLLVFESIRVSIGMAMPELFYETAHMVVIGVFLSILLVQGLRSPSLIPAIEIEEEAITQSLEAAKVLKREANPELEGQLDNYMKEHKPYLNPQIHLNDLARELEVPARLLSEVINDHHQCNFSSTSIRRGWLSHSY